MRDSILFRRRCRQQAGTSLIEVLVAMVVLSIGLLGMAGLQANSLKLNQTSMQRSQASIHAYELLDLMRSDQRSAIDGNYDLAEGGTPSSGTELAAWWERMRASMGSAASAEICRVSDPAAGACDGGGEYFRISLIWNEAEIQARDGTELGGGEQSFILVGRL